jgi:hypothetical protein|tara:strand:+ start:504 stop:677 length:174 start_codon:yes stop_codon:yes gene_type:complete
MFLRAFCCLRPSVDVRSIDQIGDDALAGARSIDATRRDETRGGGDSRGTGVRARVAE